MGTKDTIEATAASLGITMNAKFIPWSQSRNKAEKSPSLNWRITLHRSGRPILTCDYSAGSGHCPSYKQGDNSINRSDMVRRECETGAAWTGRARILPDLADVLHSLSSDADVLDYATFEDWAENVGYDLDSRRGERIYRACLDTALKLRAALGDDGMRALREAVQDY
jgi:hypothetical protein